MSDRRGKSEGESRDTFKSAIEWPEFRPRLDEATGELKPISIFLASAIETSAIAYSMAPDCESPIEIDFGVNLTKALQILDCPGLSLRPQLVLDRFRYDFAIMHDSEVLPVALVECDGKDFHESQEQVLNDHAKDMAAQKAGIYLFRFSGSQIFRDVDSCVSRVLSFLTDRGHIASEKWTLSEMSRWT